MHSATSEWKIRGIAELGCWVGRLTIPVALTQEGREQVDLYDGEVAYVDEEIPRSELYDLSADPAELENVAEQHPSSAQQLEEQLAEWVGSNLGRGGRKDPLLMPQLVDWHSR